MWEFNSRKSDGYGSFWDAETGSKNSGIKSRGRLLVGEKDWGQRRVINFKQLNKHIPYDYFKMEGLNYLKLMLQQKDYMCKLYNSIQFS